MSGGLHSWRENMFGFEEKIMNSVWTCQFVVTVEYSDRIQNFFLFLF